MNRQRFLAELRRLLVFMSEEDRDEAVRRCGEAFDAAGPEGESALIADMGSPTKLAIGLSRGYEPGKIPDVIPRTAIVRPKTEAAVPAEGELLPAEPEVTWTDLPSFDMPTVEAEEALAPEAEAAPAQTETPAPEEVPAPAEVKPERKDKTPEPVPEEAAAPAKPDTVVERTMPLGLGIPLFILVFGALGIPLGILCLALCLALLVPGAAILFGAYLIGIGGLWCTAYMADAVLLFGAAFIVLAVGLLVLWLGIWLAVKLFTVYGKGVGWIAGELLGRKVTTDA